MGDKCERCGGWEHKPPDGWKTDIPRDTWKTCKWIVYSFLALILLTAVAVAFVAKIAFLFQLCHPAATRAASWAQVFITALAGIAAGIAGFTAIRHVEQISATNQLNALTQVWESVNREDVTNKRKKLYKELTSEQKYRRPKDWTEKLESLVEPVANPLDFAGWMVLKGLLSPDVVALAYGEVFIRTYAVLQYWIKDKRDDYRPKEFKKGLKQMAEWAAVNDKNCRESFYHGHRIEFGGFGDSIEREPICLWETTVPTSSAAG